MRGRIATALLVTTVLLGACTPSQVDPGAAVSISGQAIDSDGSPLADRTAGLTIEPGPSVLFWVATSAGFACLSDLCGADHDTTTDAEGRYRFDLRGHNVQGGFGEEVDLLLAVSGEPEGDAVAGAGVRARFVVRDEATVIPTLDLWEPELSLQPPGSVVWSAATPRAGVPDRYDALFQSQTTVAFWSQLGTPDGTTIDARVLEDAQGALAAVAHVPVREPEGMREITYRSHSLAFRSRAGVPASRGAACAAISDDGDRVPLAPCPATDGVLTEPSTIELPCDPQARPCARLAGLEVQLDQARTVQLVVVRGCDRCAIDVGDSDPVQLTDRFAAVPFDEVSADQVTVRGDLDELTEVSVWDGPAAGGIEGLPELPETERADVPADPDLAADPVEDEPIPMWLAMLAAGLLGAAVATLILSTRRRPRVS